MKRGENSRSMWRDFDRAQTGSGGGGGGSSSGGRASLNIPFWFFGAAFGVAQIIDRVFT
jgi:hypothetical protein